jgi:hypothetical protein
VRRKSAPQIVLLRAWAVDGVHHRHIARV